MLFSSWRSLFYYVILQLPSISANLMSTSTVNPSLKGIYKASRLFFESYRQSKRDDVSIVIITSPLIIAEYLNHQ